MSKHILVIDDDEAIRKSFLLALKDEGYQVDTAETGKEGIEKEKSAVVSGYPRYICRYDKRCTPAIHGGHGKADLCVDGALGHYQGQSCQPGIKRFWRLLQARLPGQEFQFFPERDR